MLISYTPPANWRSRPAETAARQWGWVWSVASWHPVGRNPGIIDYSDNIIHWKNGNRAPRLDHHSIHVWRFRLDAPASLQQAGLQADEIRRYQAIEHPRQAHRFLAGRQQLRRILADYCAVPPQALRLAYGRHGKPFLAHPDRALQFNLAHTGHLALLAVSGHRPLGVDVERLRELPNRHRIAKRLFPAQSQMLAQAPVERQSLVFLYLWTRMEAAQKATGKGIFSGKTDTDSLSLLSFAPASGHIAALAWESQFGNPEIEFLQSPGTEAG